MAGRASVLSVLSVRCVAVALPGDPVRAAISISGR